jgi:hypothetical protein
LTRSPSFRRFAAGLALAGLLALEAHVLMHVFGWDNDDDGGKPCQICQQALAQTALQAVTVALPAPPATWFVREASGPQTLILRSTPFLQDSRGPPAPLNA